MRFSKVQASVTGSALAMLGVGVAGGIALAHSNHAPAEQRQIVRQVGAVTTSSPVNAPVRAHPAGVAPKVAASVEPPPTQEPTVTDQPTSPAPNSDPATPEQPAQSAPHVNTVIIGGETISAPPAPPLPSGPKPPPNPAQSDPPLSRPAPAPTVTP